MLGCLPLKTLFKTTANAQESKTITKSRGTSVGELVFA